MAKAKAAAPLSMADRDGWIWYDGKLVPWRAATTHVLTHSLHYGLAVFEGVRAYKTVSGTQIFRLREHTQRLFNSAHIYMMKIPYTIERLMEAQIEVVRANSHEACYLRPIAFYGSEKMGVSPVGAKVHVAIAAWPWGAYLGPEALNKGIRVKTASFARHHVNVTMARAKMSGTYAELDPRQPRGDAARLRRGPAARRRRLRRRGRGREHLHRQGRRDLSSRNSTSALTGITRSSVIELRRGPRLPGQGQAPHARRHLHRRRVLLHRHRRRSHADPRARRPRRSARARRGPVTKALQKAFFDVVTGKDRKHKHWLTPVPMKKGRR